MIRTMTMMDSPMQTTSSPTGPTRSIQRLGFPITAPIMDLNASNVLTISENQPVGALIGEFNATDPDGDYITYYFVSEYDNNNSLFTLDTNGTLKSAVAFDYENNASHLPLLPYRRRMN